MKFSDYYSQHVENKPSEEDEAATLPKHGGEERPEDQDMDHEEEGHENDIQEEPIDDEDEDPNRQGVIRTIKNAHLVFKRKTPDGNFEELWIYKTGERIRNEINVRRAILAGTDIPQGKNVSPDGTQRYTLWTLRNVQYMHITGLPD